MLKEEELLFPYVRALARAGRRESGLPPNMFGTVQNPIRMMETEHEAAGNAMTLIRELTGGYETPADGCATYATALAELKAFEQDLHAHVHLENHVLFPRSIELESRLMPGLG